MALRPLNNDQITVSNYRFKKRIELLENDVDILEQSVEEKTAVCQELIEENKKLTAEIEDLKKPKRKRKSKEK